LLTDDGSNIFIYMTGKSREKSQKILIPNHSEEEAKKKRNSTFGPSEEKIEEEIRHFSILEDTENGAKKQLGLAPPPHTGREQSQVSLKFSVFLIGTNIFWKCSGNLR
jgi:hypothetical protein